MDFALTEDVTALRARAVSLVELLTAYELPCEEQGGLSSDDLAEIRGTVLASGLNAINMPTKWGGAGLSTLHQVVVHEQLGSLTNHLWYLVWKPANALAACTAAQRETYLLPAIRGEKIDCYAITEPSAGSDPTMIETTAVPDRGGYRLSGVKWFASLADVADFLIVMASVEPNNALTLFLVDKNAPGLTLGRNPRFTGTGVFGHPEISLENVYVADDAVLGTVGSGFELTKEWFIEERLMIAARSLGAAERSLRLAAAWASERVQFGRPIGDNQFIQGMLADSAVDIMGIRSHLYQVGWEADHGCDRKLLHAKSAMLKLAASEMAGRVVDRAVQIFGGRGYMRDNPVERLSRDVRIDRIWEGTSEIQRIIIANEIRKRGLDGILGVAARTS